MFVVLIYWILVTSYVTKANWYTFIPCYLLHLNLSPTSTFGKKTPSQDLVKLTSELTVPEIPPSCAPGMTVGSRKEAAWAWQFSEETILHSVLSNTMVALMESKRLQGGDWEQKAT